MCARARACSGRGGGGSTGRPKGGSYDEEVMMVGTVSENTVGTGWDLRTREAKRTVSENTLYGLDIRTVSKNTLYGLDIRTVSENTLYGLDIRTVSENTFPVLCS